MSICSVQAKATPEVVRVSTLNEWMDGIDGMSPFYQRLLSIGATDAAEEHFLQATDSSRISFEGIAQEAYACLKKKDRSMSKQYVILLMQFCDYQDGLYRLLLNRPSKESIDVLFSIFLYDENPQVRRMAFIMLKRKIEQMLARNKEARKDSYLLQPRTVLFLMDAFKRLSPDPDISLTLGRVLEFRSLQMEMVTLMQNIIAESPELYAAPEWIERFYGAIRDGVQVITVDKNDPAKETYTRTLSTERLAVAHKMFEIISSVMKKMKPQYMVSANVQRYVRFHENNGQDDDVRRRTNSEKEELRKHVGEMMKIVMDNTISLTTHDDVWYICAVLDFFAVQHLTDLNGLRKKLIGRLSDFVVEKPSWYLKDIFVKRMIEVDAVEVLDSSLSRLGYNEAVPSPGFQSAVSVLFTKETLALAVEKKRDIFITMCKNYIDQGYNIPAVITQEMVDGLVVQYMPQEQVSGGLGVKGMHKADQALLDLCFTLYKNGDFCCKCDELVLMEQVRTMAQKIDNNGLSEKNAIKRGMPAVVVLSEGHMRNYSYRNVLVREIKTYLSSQQYTGNHLVISLEKKGDEYEEKCRKVLEKEWGIPSFILDKITFMQGGVQYGDLMQRLKLQDRFAKAQFGVVVDEKMAFANDVRQFVAKERDPYILSVAFMLVRNTEEDIEKYSRDLCGGLLKKMSSKAYYSLHEDMVKDDVMPALCVIASAA